MMMRQNPEAVAAKNPLTLALEALDRHFADLISEDAVAKARRRLRLKALLVVAMFLGGYALAIFADSLWLIVPGLVAVGFPPSPRSRR